MSEILNIKIEAEDLQALLGDIELKMEYEGLKLESDAKAVYKGLCNIFRTTNKYKADQEEWAEIRKRFKENENAKKIIPIEQLRAKRA